MKRNKFAHHQQSGIHNLGLYAKQDIAADTPIIQYIGNKLTHKQAEKLAETKDDSHVYLFVLNKRHVIDGDTKTNLAKYINHSCEPNCYSDIINNEIWIYALRDISKGEELSYDYGFERPGWHEHPCHCGTKHCFGFIVAEKHWPSIRKTKRYQKLIKKR